MAKDPLEENSNLETAGQEDVVPTRRFRGCGCVAMFGILVAGVGITLMPYLQQRLAVKRIATMSGEKWEKVEAAAVGAGLIVQCRGLTPGGTPCYWDISVNETGTLATKVTNLVRPYGRTRFGKWYQQDAFPTLYVYVEDLATSKAVVSNLPVLL